MGRHYGTGVDPISNISQYQGYFLGVKADPIEIQIKRRKWSWIGHTLRKEAGGIKKTEFDWNPVGYRRRRRPKRTWRRTIKDEIRNT
jgi:hypothetical protein